MLGEGLRDLAATIRAEVEADHHVVRTDGGQGSTLRIHHNVRLDEFVRLAGRIAAAERIQRIGHGNAAAMHQVLVRLGHSLPSLVAVHGEVPAGDAGDTCSRAFDPVQEQLRVAQSTTRVGIAPIGESMDEEFAHTSAMRHLAERFGVYAHGMHTAVGEQPHQVQATARFAGLREGLLQHRVAFQAAVGDRVVHAHQVLVHHTARADVEVPHFAVAHLAGRKAHVNAISEECGVRCGAVERIDERGVSCGHGVRAVTRTDAPTIHDDQYDLAWLFHQRSGNEAAKIAPVGAACRTSMAPPRRCTSRCTM